MTNGATAGAGGAGAAAAAHQAVVNAISSAGPIIKVESDVFMEILAREGENAVVIAAKCGWLSKHYKYLTVRKGLYFWCKVDSELRIPENAEIYKVKKLWIPGA